MGRPRKQQESDILIAVESGIWVNERGEEHLFYADITRVRVGHPMAKAMPHCFAPINVHYDVERWHGEDTETRFEVTA